MANIWYRSEEEAEWVPAPVSDDSRYCVVEFLPRSNVPVVEPRQRVRRTARSRHGSRQRFMLVRLGAARMEKWYAILFPGVRLSVNGRAVQTRLVPLRDRDLIGSAASERSWIFTTERAARVVQFDGAPGIFCPRCKLPVEADQLVVVCPGCHTIHHQDAGLELPCWTYAESCCQCDQATSLSPSEYTWTPHEL